MKKNNGIIQVGNLRLGVVNDGCVRIEYAEEGTFCDEPTLFATMRSYDFQGFSVSDDGIVFTLETARFQLIYHHQANEIHHGGLIVKLPDGKSWTPGQSDDANLAGTIASLDDCSRPCPLNEGLLSLNGFYAIDDSQTPLIANGILKSRPVQKHYYDLYFFAYGNDYKSALRSLTQLSGEIPMLPRFVMGSWYSRWYQYTSQDYRDIIDEYQQHCFPLDVIVFDMEWHTRNADPAESIPWGGTPGWTGWTYNRELLPDAEALLGEIQERKIHIAFNAHPHNGVRKHEAMYQDFMKELHCDPDGPSLDFDAGNPEYMAAYFKYTHAPREREGVDLWWVDWQQDSLIPHVKGFPEIKHLPWLNYCYYHHMESARKRGVSFSRWGGWGDQKHPLYFSGDATSNWEMLAFEVPFTAVAGNCGCFFWSHDIGGFCGERNEELYARWLQFGATTISMRLHSAGEEIDRRPWKWSEPFFSSMRKSFELRGQLMPYLYTMMRKCHTDSLPMIRPMYLEYPIHEEAYRQPQQYLLGDCMLAAPIVTPGSGEEYIAFQTVWIPDDKIYFNYFSGERMLPGEHVVAANLNEFPLYVEGGVPLPLGKMGKTLAELPSVLNIQIFPLEGKKEFTLYEDDGFSQEYRVGGFAETKISSYYDGERLFVVEIFNPKGKYADTLHSFRTYEITIRNLSHVQMVTMDKQSLPFVFDDQTHRCVISLGDRIGTIEIIAEVRMD